VYRLGTTATERDLFNEMTDRVMTDEVRTNRVMTDATPRSVVSTPLSWQTASPTTHESRTIAIVVGGQLNAAVSRSQQVCPARSSSSSSFSVQRLRSIHSRSICCGFLVRTACCTTNPQQIEHVEFALYCGLVVNLLYEGRTPLVRLVVNLMSNKPYNKIHNKPTTNRARRATSPQHSTKSRSLLYDKSTTNRTSGVTGGVASAGRSRRGSARAGCARLTAATASRRS